MQSFITARNVYPQVNSAETTQCTEQTDPGKNPASKTNEKKCPKTWRYKKLGTVD